MHPSDEKSGRFLSLLLRHKPEVAGLEIEPGGWVCWLDLLRGLRAARRQWDISEECLHRIIREDSKDRYELDVS